MKLTGFADEAGPALADQIRAHRQLGWDTIEMRTVDGPNFVSLDEAAYRRCRDELRAAGMGVSCFGSAIANWARKISGDFQQDLDDLRRAAPRMRELGVRLIRVMSYPNDGLSGPEWFKEAVRRLKELARIAEGEGVILAHENCSGYGGQSPRALGELLAAVDSPAFQTAFDTGNPPAHDPEHCAEGYTWEFYQVARPRLAHLHVKDARPGADGKPEFCFPGEGVGDVRRVLADLAAAGYDGYVSIEPHLKGAVHLGEQAGKAASAFEVYLEYGRRAARLVAEARAAGAAGKKAPAGTR